MGLNDGKMDTLKKVPGLGVGWGWWGRGLGGEGEGGTPSHVNFNDKHSCTSPGAYEHTFIYCRVGGQVLSTQWY